jgi:hypothetical protein
MIWRKCAAVLEAQGQTLGSAANLSGKAGSLQIGRRAGFVPSVIETVNECP